jgi:outer membrane protein assembly factor BamB
MFRQVRRVILLSFVTLIPSLPAAAQLDSGWRISPARINIQLGADRPLQLLDDSAQELDDATWSVDNPDLATIQEQDGRVVLHAKKIGTVLVTAVWGGEMRTREIKIWSDLRPLPPGTTNWGMDPIGSEIGDLPAVPTSDGPTTYSLEQTSSGKAYLRAVRDDGIQVWTWLMPGQTHKVELICGDWLGGALISASVDDSYTLYAVAKDGELRWQRTMKGVRKGLADSTDHLVHVLNQSSDGITTTVVGLDEKTGAQWFDLAVPVSHEKQINLRREGSRISCAQGSVSNPTPARASRLMVNMDGYGYLAFTQTEWILTTGKCTLGQTVDPKDVTLARDDKLVLWKIDPDGSYRAIVVEATKNKQPLSAPTSVVSPTNALVTDNMNGTLIPVRVSHNVTTANADEPVDEFVYRVNQDGELLYKLPLPKYSGPLKDDMVIGEDNVAFATRGSYLIAFSLVTGKELWRWESSEPEISVFAALANGACLVQTPTVLMEVASSTKAKSIFQGKAMMDWQGRMYRKHN